MSKVSPEKGDRLMSGIAVHNRSLKIALAGFIAWLAVLVVPQPAQAEYADVVINNFADAAGMRPVVFSLVPSCAFSLQSVSCGFRL